ncbi:MAG: Glu/Leu/Phe/Val dehydrogenase dimerization domain-containing protein, partial [Candidatus Omnitrophota bacterium]
DYWQHPFHFWAKNDFNLGLGIDGLWHWPATLSEEVVRLLLSSPYGISVHKMQEIVSKDLLHRVGAGVRETPRRWDDAMEIDRLIAGRNGRINHFCEIIAELIRAFGSIQNMRGKEAVELGPDISSLGLISLLRDYGVNIIGIGGDLGQSSENHLIQVNDYYQYLASRNSAFDVVLANFSLYKCSGKGPFEAAAAALKPGGLLIRVSGAEELSLTNEEIKTLGMSLIRDYKVVRNQGTSNQERRVLVLRKDKLQASVAKKDIFMVSDNAADTGLATALKGLNQLNASPAVIEAVLNDAQLKQKACRIIRAQDREDDTAGFAVNRVWAAEFKEEVLKRALKHIEGRDIFILQMEYSLSARFLQEFSQHLIKMHGCSPEDAVYNTGELTKIFMAGGLGSFKPDLVKGWYQVLSEHWGSIEARNRLYVMGVLYARDIKGHGPIQACGSIAGKDIIELVRKALFKVKTYHGIKLNTGSYGNTVDVEVYMNPYSELKEYWLYCPQVFHELYCGDRDDDFRAVQSLLYRKVLLRFIKDGISEGNIGRQLLFSTSEVNTTVAIPRVINDEYKNDPVFNGLKVHHYNHTIVPDGLPRYHWYMFDALKISGEFRPAIREGFVDLVEITGEVSDIITGCSSRHTHELRSNIFKKFAHKVREDGLFGNSEGVDIERWQGEQISVIIRKYMLRLKAVNCLEFFGTLQNSPAEKLAFMQELSAARKEQEREFVSRLFKGTFGNIGISRQEFESGGASLEERPIFVFVRRMVDYKCVDLIIDILYDKAFRERIIKSGAVIVVGGRKFGAYASLQDSRIRKLIEEDSRMKQHIIFISNHNVFTSWIIEQCIDFGGMLSWRGKEAGPTSYAKAQVNGAPTLASPDGVIPERVKPINRDAQGRPLSGTGYIVAYGEERSFSGDIKPERESFVAKLEEACADYFNPENYQEVSFNALRTGMLQSDIRNQAKGLICLWAEMISPAQNTTSPIEGLADRSRQGHSTEEVEAMINACDGIEHILKGEIKDWIGQLLIGQAIREAAIILGNADNIHLIYSLLQKRGVHFALAPPEWYKIGPEFGPAIGILPNPLRPAGIEPVIILTKDTIKEDAAHEIIAALVKLEHWENELLDNREFLDRKTQRLKFNQLPGDLAARILAGLAGEFGSVLDPSAGKAAHMLYSPVSFDSEKKKAVYDSETAPVTYAFDLKLRDDAGKVLLGRKPVIPEQIQGLNQEQRERLVKMLPEIPAYLACGPPSLPIYMQISRGMPTAVNGKSSLITLEVKPDKFLLTLYSIFVEDNAAIARFFVQPALEAREFLKSQLDHEIIRHYLLGNTTDSSADNASLANLLLYPQALQNMINVLSISRLNHIYALGNWLTRLTQAKGLLDQAYAKRSQLIKKLSKLEALKYYGAVTIDNCQPLIKNLAGIELKALEDFVEKELAPFVFPGEDGAAEDNVLALACDLIMEFLDTEKIIQERDALYSALSEQRKAQGQSTTIYSAARGGFSVDWSALNICMRMLGSKDKADSAKERILAMDVGAVIGLKEEMVVLQGSNDCLKQAGRHDPIKEIRLENIRGLLEELLNKSCLIKELRRLLGRNREADTLIRRLLDERLEAIQVFPSYEKILINAQIANTILGKATQGLSAEKVREVRIEGRAYVIYHVNSKAKGKPLNKIQDLHAWLGVEGPQPADASSPSEEDPALGLKVEIIEGEGGNNMFRVTIRGQSKLVARLTKWEPWVACGLIEKLPTIAFHSDGITLNGDHINFGDPGAIKKFKQAFARSMSGPSKPKPVAPTAVKSSLPPHPAPPAAPVPAAPVSTAPAPAVPLPPALPASVPLKTTIGQTVTPKPKTPPLPQWMQDALNRSRTLAPLDINKELFFACQEAFDLTVSEFKGSPCISLFFTSSASAGPKTELRMILRPKHLIVVLSGDDYIKFGEQTVISAIESGVIKVDEYNGQPLLGFAKGFTGTPKFIVTKEFSDLIKNKPIFHSLLYALEDFNEVPCRLIWPYSNECALFKQGADKCRGWGMAVTEDTITLQEGVTFKKTMYGMAYQAGKYYMLFKPEKAELETANLTEPYVFKGPSVLRGWALNSENKMCAIYDERSGFSPPSETYLLYFITLAKYLETRSEFTEIAFFMPEEPKAETQHARVITQLLGLVIGILKGNKPAIKGFFRVSKESYLKQLQYISGRLIRSPPIWALVILFPSSVIFLIASVFVFALFRPIVSVKDNEFIWYIPSESLSKFTRDSLLVHENKHLSLSKPVSLRALDTSCQGRSNPFLDCFASLATFGIASSPAGDSQAPRNDTREEIAPRNDTFKKSELAALGAQYEAFNSTLSDYKHDFSDRLVKVLFLGPLFLLVVLMFVDALGGLSAYFTIKEAAKSAGAIIYWQAAVIDILTGMVSWFIADWLGQYLQKEQQKFRLNQSLRIGFFCGLVQILTHMLYNSLELLGHVFPCFVILPGFMQMVSSMLVILSGGILITLVNLIIISWARKKSAAPGYSKDKELNKSFDVIGFKVVWELLKSGVIITFVAPALRVIFEQLCDISSVIPTYIMNRLNQIFPERFYNWIKSHKIKIALVLAAIAVLGASALWLMIKYYAPAATLIPDFSGIKFLAMFGAAPAFGGILAAAGVVAFENKKTIEERMIEAGAALTADDYEDLKDASFQDVAENMLVVAEEIKLDKAIFHKLFQVYKNLKVEIPLTRDNGASEIITGYRILHNDARGAGKGGIR